MFFKTGSESCEYENETFSISTSPCNVLLISRPSLYFSGALSIAENISSAAARPLCITAFKLDSCLIGLAINPAAVKKATKDSEGKFSSLKLVRAK